METQTLINISFALAGAFGGWILAWAAIVTQNTGTYVVEYLVVAGGGSGGGATSSLYVGGGGGAGGYRSGGGPFKWDEVTQSWVEITENG